MGEAGDIDGKLVPKRLLFDTGVLIRALEGSMPKHRDDPRTRDCRDLWEHVLRRSEGEVVVAAPSIFELGAKRKKKAALCR